MNFNPKETGIRISILRQQMGMTQEQFAELNNITRNHLAKLECGLKKPSIELLVTFSENTGRSLDYLITGRNAGMPEIKGQLRELIDSLSRLERQL